jgi:2-isopropylmalate synthase
MEGSSTARAAAYVSVKGKDEKIYWGAGVDSDILAASVLALISAVNNMLKEQA